MRRRNPFAQRLDVSRAAAPSVTDAAAYAHEASSTPSPDDAPSTPPTALPASPWARLPPRSRLMLRWARVLALPPHAAGLDTQVMLRVGTKVLGTQVTPSARCARTLYLTSI